MKQIAETDGDADEEEPEESAETMVTSPWHGRGQGGGSYTARYGHKNAK